jgi:cation transporter-like permease
VLEGLPGVGPAEARAAVAAAWADHRAGRDPDRTDPVRARAADVVADAVRAFGA